MLELDDALNRILATVPPPASEPIALTEAQGRVLAEPLTAAIDLPPFDNSAMDGYAVRAADVGAAQPDTPVGLHLIGKVAAGTSFSGTVTAGTCVRLFTGSPLPHGADAVVMQEDTQVAPGQPETILIRDAVKAWENVRLHGEDIRRGSPLAAPGEILTAGRRSLLGATGVSQVRVGRQPVVGLLATGSELQAPGRPLGCGQIYESNGIGLTALVQTAGGIPRLLPPVADVLTSTRTALTEAFQQCDAVVTSGGVSVGELDFLKSAFQDIGGELQFWKVAIKPGKPFVFGRWQQKFLFGLPGNPVSAFVTFLLLARPALRRWQGAAEVALPRHPGWLAEPLSNPGDRRHFWGVRVDTGGRVFSAGPQASHRLSSLAAANGLVDVPPQTELPAGATVEVLRWE